jgi:hypothetical protein
MKAPEAPSSKVDRLTPLQVINPQMTEKEHRAAERKLRADMLAEMDGTGKRFDLLPVWSYFFSTGSSACRLHSSKDPS